MEEKYVPEHASLINRKSFLRSMPNIVLLVLLAGTAVFSAPMRLVRAAAILHVPSEYSTIQAALNASLGGDTILVSAGTYEENLDFYGKDITLQSETGKTNTFIKSNGGIAVTIGPGGKLIGFTIEPKNMGLFSGSGISVTGAGTLIQGNSVNGFMQGNPHIIISGYSASPIIDRNSFNGNNWDPFNNNAACIGFTGVSSPVITNNQFYYDACTDLNMKLPAGSSPRVINNQFLWSGTGILIDKGLPTASHVYRNNIFLFGLTALQVDGGTGSFDAAWDHNLAFGNNVNYIGISDLTGTNGNISVDPMLDYRSHPPFMPKHGSPVIDAGSNTDCPVFDFLGTARPQGGTCDIGNYEGYYNGILSINRDDPEVTTASSVHYTVTFAETVTGVDTVAPFQDFVLTSTGITGAAITSVSGSENIYHVTVDTGSGSGTLRLDFVDNDTIVDSYGLPIGGIGPGNGNFVSGQVYNLDRTGPTITSILRADPDPRLSTSVRFKITFSEPTTDVYADDFVLTTTGLLPEARISDVRLSEGYTMYQVTVITGDGTGTIRLDVPSSATISDMVGNPLENFPYEEGESYTISHYSSFLPLSIYHLQKTADIFGYLLANELPVAYQWVELRFYNGSYWYTFMQATTDSDGFYGFNGLPTLGVGQAYYVRYQNSNNYPEHLWLWGSRVLTTYTSGTKVFVGMADIANIGLISPPNSTSVKLPYTFQWTTRPATPADIYEFDLYDYTDGNPYYYTQLGYTGSYTLSNLPGGFYLNSNYAWEIWVYSPDGGYGISLESRLVKFSNKGSGLLPTFSLAGRQIKNTNIPLDIPER